MKFLLFSQLFFSAPVDVKDVAGCISAGAAGIICNSVFQGALFATDVEQKGTIGGNGGGDPSGNGGGNNDPSGNGGGNNNDPSGNGGGNNNDPSGEGNGDNDYKSKKYYRNHD